MEQRMKRMMLSLLLCISIAIAGCSSSSTTAGGGSNPDKSDKPGGGSTTGPAKVNLKDLPAVALKAEDLFKEFKADRDAVNSKYKGKSIEVSGIVFMSHRNNAAAQPVVWLEGKKDTKNAFDTIQCVMDSSDEGRVDELAKGQTAKIRGVVAEFGDGLINCEFVETGPTTAIKESISELVSAFEKDKKQAGAKYDDKDVRLTGKVAELKWEGKVLTIVLEDTASKAKTPARIEVRCEADINPKLKTKLDKIAQGQNVEIQGRCQASEFDSKINVISGKVLK
jgi:hypothetical protein